MSSSDSESSFVHKKRHKEKKGKRDRSRPTSRSRNRKDRKEKKRRRHDSKSSSSSSRKNKNKNIKREDRKRKHEIEDLKDREIQRRQQMESKRKTEEDLKKKKKLKEESHQKEELTEEEKLKRKKQSRYAKAIAVALLDSVDEKKKENEVLKNDELEDFMQIKNEQKTKDILVDELENFEDAQIETPLQLPQLTFNFMNKKMPQLPKEFLKNKTETKITETRKLSENEDEDPLDAYMKSIEKEAVIQDYELVQMLNRQELQRQYDEIAEKQDSVIMIDSIKSEKKDLSEEIEISENLPMVVTLDDIFQEKQPQQDENEEEDEEFHKKFIECLKGTKVPEYDPILGYTFINEEKKENVIYQEDVNEFRKEADFVEMEEAWRNAKKSGEKGKELKLVNHAEIDYEPFRKDFYKESKEIAMMTEEEVVNYRKENGDIKIRGKNIPKPISNWYQCGFYEKILAVLEKKGYKKPFPIQAQGVPCIMSGRDVIGIAETGSGKTLAYVLPMLRHVLDQRRLREGEGPISIIFAPTRELATQIYSVVKSFTKILNLRVSCVYGGSGIGPQVSELRRGAEIVVCTPGRMIEILCMNNGKVTNLQRVSFV
jgi:ATP-dependent RNA helicase DDX46/PRP5